ncbi:hypothetical protein SAICODRAFT_70793 [Saitoella complicata NRRL Y-17804]|uniref:CID domain-containing protein n=1 Tax=Saitoella complicata (strain BCRC 22490 / CBS 7301 / JCM 7358 / NBRC 10748 / NRRL Y-17804) TaxID=698492 RepID=A0A0E9NHE5_SAICN|nr:uncharacterized protein SAICODRAFT_70793 [Saitoella complicata NRRL Y-17804]ODQ53654.1 hypothetical protein SAICODRAFT_70793 [Saitoella complicata NRRL Y-17804]GAO48830.1 hypothetical protein G7K_2999-t1 [Saitoella complicata NRRL Y-17804]
MDPFDGRLKFTDLLRRLNASQLSAGKCASFAIKQKHLDEDLFSCVIEELEQTSMNARVNILYFLETLCDASVKAGVLSYRSLLASSIGAIVDAVAPEGAAGSANVATVRKVLANLRVKGYLEENTLAGVETTLAGREASQPVAIPGSQSFSKGEILRRMEEDRERHKRLRENIWAIPPQRYPGDENVEFERAWEQTADLDQGDYEEMREHNAAAESAYVG